MEEILEGARDAMNVRRVYGDPVEQEGVTVIPAAVVGGGGGGGGDSEQNGGAGFGVRAKPAGAYVIRGQEVTWVPAVDVTRIVLYSLVAMLLAAALLRRR
ncbi:MAG TPA: hypothetical protein VHH55_09365 [Gaiellaceae bacterium]|nr:hypothetical protein [Gaiellaceae bacterium]